MFVALRRAFLVVKDRKQLRGLRELNWIGTFEESVLRIRALPRDIQACTKIVAGEFEFTWLEKKKQKIQNEKVEGKEV